MNLNSKDTLKVESLGPYDPVIGRDLWRLEDTRSRTLDAIAGTSQTTLDWSDFPIGNSIGTLLYHIAAIETSWLFSEILGIEFPSEIDTLYPVDVRDSEDHLSRITGVSLSEHLDRLTRTRTYLLDSLRSFSVKEYQKPRNFPEYEVTPEWVIHHLVQHEAEHRGQILEIRNAAERSLG